MMAGSVKSGYLLSGRYRIEELIGTGAQSTVYRAVDELLWRDVAVKIFRQHSGNLEQVRRQESEVRILAGMSHPALVTLFDAGADLNDPQNPLSYLVMELVRGPDLRSRGAAGPLSAARMAHIGHDLADGLAYIHHHGIVHRDVKPANVLLVQEDESGSRPRAKLSDFGVALLLGDERELPKGGSSSGTPHYLSPEQAIGEPAGSASDVYSLGLVLLEGLTGKVTYPGAPIESALARLLRNPDIPDGIGPRWVKLLTYMLARDPDARPAAREVSLSLRQEIATSTGRRSAAGDLAQDEEARMRAVHRYRILDTPPDGTFDRVVAVAARMFDVPVAIVSIVDHDRIWFKARHGTDLDEIGRDPGLCASAVLQDEAWVLENAAVDPRSLANPLVAGEANMKFYAGVPLRTPDGYNLGTLCVLDRKPREFTSEDTAALESLAAIVMNDLELRLQTMHILTSTGAAQKV